MKQKAKIYKGKRIVIGDKNLVTKNEIHVNDIPQEGGESGGGGNAPSGGNSLEYYSTTDFSTVGELIFFVSLIKHSYASTNTVTIVSSAAFTDILDGRASLLAIGIDMSLPVVLDNVAGTPREFLESMGLTDVTALGWTPITKEEFYAI